MQFEWNEAKSNTNLAERGFGFDFAALVFEGPTLEVIDDRRDYGEERINAIGLADGFVLAVTYTDRVFEDLGTIRRIISARLANRKERALWRSFASR